MKSDSDTFSLQEYRERLRRAREHYKYGPHKEGVTQDAEREDIVRPKVHPFLIPLAGRVGGKEGVT